MNTTRDSDMRGHARDSWIADKRLAVRLGARGLACIATVLAALATAGAASASVLRSDGARLIVATPAGDADASLQNPAFSPDGSRVIYTKYLCGYDAANDGNCAPEQQGGQLLSQPAAGGSITALWGDCSKLPPNQPRSCADEATNVNGLASWAGNRIAFAASGNGAVASGGNGDIATVLSTGSPASVNQVTDSTHAPPGISSPLSYLEPTFNATGTTIAFQGDQLGDGDDDDDFFNHASILLIHPNPPHLGTGLTTLINGPGEGTDNRLPVWSPDGTTILFQRRTDFSDPNHQNMPYNLWTINPTTKVRKQITGATGQPTHRFADDSDASWSPDGKWVLDSAIFYNAAQEPNIWLVSANGSQLVRATASNHEDGAPVMSRDGKWVYFESHVGAGVPGESSVSQIYRIAAPVRSDGSMQVFRPTTTLPLPASGLCSAARPDNCSSAQNPCYVPNSNALLFTDFSDSYNNDTNTGTAGLFSVPAAGGNPRSVVLHSGHSAVDLPGSCYSAKTGKIAYSSDFTTAHSNTDNIWTALPAGTNHSEHQVTCYLNPVNSLHEWHAQEPSWSQDGQTIVYERDDGKNVNVTTIWTIPASDDCTHPVQPTEIVPAPKGRCPGQTATPPADNHQPNWSPDGKHILFQSSANDGASTVNLWMVDRNGCGLTQITKDSNSDTDASWSPDSSSIVYSTDLGATGPGFPNLWIVKAVAGGQKRRLTSQCYLDGAPSWSPDGKWVSFESWPDPHGDTNDHPTSIWRISTAAHPAAPSC